MVLRTVVISRLLQTAESFDVDVIEVIRHTDEQPETNRVSNLDRHLSSVTLGGADAGVLQWADNAGLGLARAGGGQGVGLRRAARGLSHLAAIGRPTH